MSGELNTENFFQHKIAYIIIIIVIIALILAAKNCLGLELKGPGEGKLGEGRFRGDGNGESHYLGRGHPSESTAVLLDRIEWSTYLENRISIVSRFVLITIIIMLFVICVIMQKVPTPAKTILLFLVVFIPMYATHQMHYVHGDVYNDYYIKKNVHMLREKLGLKKGHPVHPRSNIPGRTDVMHP